MLNYSISFVSCDLPPNNICFILVAYMSLISTKMKQIFKKGILA